MTILDIYRQYRIMPNLQQHQLRVAGVAKVICDNFNSPLDAQSVIAACLLHDMGNILKFDLTTFPEFVQPEGQAYWQGVKDEFLAQYGADEHQASLKIAAEVGASERVLELIDAISFSQADDNAETDDFAIKICAYADMRVTPFGVVSLDERLQDLENRYARRYPTPEQVENRRKYRQALHEVETQIFADLPLKPEEITEKLVREQFPSFETTSVGESAS